MESRQDEDVELDTVQTEQPAAELRPEVLARLPEREPEALGLFFDAYFPRVYGYLRRLTGDEHLAEDLTQDVFFHVYRAFESYDPTRELRPWVFTIATNKVRDHWRSRRHRDSLQEESVERDGPVDHLADAGPRPHEGLSGEEMDEKLRAAVDGLPDGMRVTVLLRVYEGLSFEDIGGILERSEVAVRKRYSRALEALREALGPAWRIHVEGS